MPSSRLHTRLITGALTLLLIAASRVLLLSHLSFDHDEVWSVWQTFGTPQEIIARTPFDWPAGYYLSLGAAVSDSLAHEFLWRTLFMVDCGGYRPFDWLWSVAPAQICVDDSGLRPDCAAVCAVGYYGL